MKVIWKQAMFGALLLLGVAAEGQDDNSNVGASNLECDDVILVSQGLIQHDRSLRDNIELLLDYKREVKQHRREGRIEVKEDNDESSFSRRFLNIFRHYYVPPTPPEENPTPAIPLPSSPDNKEVTVHRHYWPLPTDVEIGKQFEARVLVGFVGNPYALSDEEKDELSDAFLDTYASLEEREDVTITSVRFIDDLTGVDTQRELQDSSKDLVDYAIKFNKLLGITGMCNDCDDNPRLFADDVQGRKLAIPSMAPHQYLREESFHRKTQESCVGCPTIEQFVDLYNDTITELRSNGILMNVVSLDGTIVEQEPVECPSDKLTDFESVVDVTFNLTAEPSDVELEALGRSFVESYNQANALNGETCDLTFRVVESAVASKADNATVNSQNRELGNGAVYKLIFDGKCRNCKPKSKSTCDDCSGRRALHSGNAIQNNARPEWMLGDAGLPYRNRGLQDTAIQCYCPIGEPEERLPSIEELLAAYDDNVQFLANEGTLTSVSSVVDIVEESQTNKECDSDDDCDDDQQCIANICVTLGIPTFRLIWTGDDDLDLHVLTPAGNEIYYGNPFADSGVLDQDDIPYEERDWVENVFFPSDGSAPPGTYTYWVVQFGQTGAADADPWELQVLDRETVIQSESGTAEDLTAEDFLTPPESTRYTFEYNP
jgi:hypothetical protein